MNRKNFLSSVLALGAAIPAGRSTIGRSPVEPEQLPTLIPTRIPALIVPPYLQPGDTIGITCPAGDITLAAMQPAIDLIESWGFRIKPGDTVGKKDFIFGGSDEERAADLQRMMDDPSLKAILCGRGGYGSVRIIDKLDLTGLSQTPKWIIGFSDITV